MKEKKENYNDQDSNYDLSDELRARILRALEDDLFLEVNDLFLQLHPADQADFITSISYELREKLVGNFDKNIDPQFLTFLENNIRNEVIEFLGAHASAKAIDQLEIEEAVHVVGDLGHEGISDILDHISKEKRSEIEEVLSHKEGSIGRLMHQNFVAVKQNWSVGEATKYLQEQNDLPSDFQHIVVVDDNNYPISQLLLSKIIRNKKHILISQIMEDEEDMKIFNVATNEEEAARLFGKYSLTYAPVIDGQNKLVGVIYANDLFNLLEEQKDASLYDFAGISDEENVNDDTIRKVKFRYKWLILNLATAFLAAFTVGLFEETISKYVLLAVYMPIVAGMGGNAATQTLAVLVRGIAFNQITLKTMWPVLRRELSASAINGLINGAIVAVIVILFSKDIKIALILGIAMIANLLVAGFFGTMVPLIMKYFGKDPATSATIFITTATDVLGFLAFLGLAASLL